MPGKPATGPAVKTLVVDTIQIMNYTVTTNSEGSESIEVNYSSGWIGDEGEFVAYENFQTFIEGDNFVAFAAKKPSMNGGLFAALQSMIYDEIERDQVEKEDKRSATAAARLAGIERRPNAR